MSGPQTESWGKTILRYIGRGLAGFGLGYLWSGAVALGWLALGAIRYGGFDEFLNGPGHRHDPLVLVTTGGYFTSAAAAWVGSFLGPLFAGSKARIRGPIIISSIFAAFLSVVAGTPVRGISQRGRRNAGRLGFGLDLLARSSWD